MPHATALPLNNFAKFSSSYYLLSEQCTATPILQKYHFTVCFFLQALWNFLLVFQLVFLQQDTCVSSTHIHDNWHYFNVFIVFFLAHMIT